MSLTTTLMEAPSRLNKFIDACTCGRSDKATIAAIKQQLEAKDVAIEKLEEEIRRKDTEKDNLIHMQRDLQSQIEEIRLLLENHATDAKAAAELSDDRAAMLMQRRVRGISSRKRVNEIKEEKQQSAAALRMQARVRGKSARRLVGGRATGAAPGSLAGISKELPAAPSAAPRAASSAASPPKMPQGGGPHITASPTGASSVTMAGAGAGGAEYAGSGFSVGEGSSMFDDGESVDSDYDYDDNAFSALGQEMLSGRLKLAKVYGQEEPPAAEDELEWEVRYFMLYDSGRICHYDGLEGGLPVGDRGLIDLSSIRSVEKVLGVPTFVMKGEMKVYLFKIEPHDEVMMRTWIAAISQQLKPAK